MNRLKLVLSVEARRTGGIRLLHREPAAPNRPLFRPGASDIDRWERVRRSKWSGQREGLEGAAVIHTFGIS